MQLETTTIPEPMEEETVQAQPTTIAGPIVEEPDTYAPSSPTPPRPARHRTRRATSITLVPQNSTQSIPEDAPISFPRRVKARLRSTIYLPDYNMLRRGSRAASDPQAKPCVKQDSVSSIETQLPLQELEEKEPTFDDCFTITPQFLMRERYKRTFTHAKRYANGVSPNVRALQTRFEPCPVGQSPGIDLRWIPYESPEGSLYFREETKNILTVVDLHNETYLEAMSKFSLHLLQKLQDQADLVPPDTDIIVHLRDNGEDLSFGYYLASWERRCVFWLEEVSYDLITEEVRVCSTESHIGRYIEFLFWYAELFRQPLFLTRDARIHAEMFPSHHGVPVDVLEDLKNQFNLGLYDQITSKSSLFPYNKEEATETLRCLEKVVANETNPHSLWIVARCKQNIAETAFLNYYGERGSKIHRGDSVLHGDVRRPRSLFFFIISPVLFFMPSVYMEEIDYVWIDRTVDWITWRKFITMLIKDWDNSITPATVLLSANVGFLAIQSIDSSNAHRSAAQIASYISAILSLFNYVVCQVLARHHRHSHDFGAAKASEFFQNRERQWLGLESVALTFSLPTALLIWSMLTFLVALMIVFFWHTSRATRFAVGAVLIVLFFMTFALLWLDWQGHQEYREESILYRLCPPGLRTALLGVKDNWKRRLSLRFRSSGASVGSNSTESSDSGSTVTAVNSPNPEK